MRRTVFYLILLLLHASYLGCQADLEPVVVVRIPEVPAEVVKLVVKSQLGTHAGNALSISVSEPGELRFGVSVAPDSSEKLTLQLVGFSGNDCTAAEGELAIPLASASFPYFVDVPLSLLPQQRCTLNLHVKASQGVNARVTSIPPLLDCTPDQGQCSYSFAPSTTATIELLAETDVSAYFTWLGSCQGNGVCKIALDRSREEQVVFDQRECLVPSVCFHSPTPRDAVFTAISAAGDSAAWAVGFSTGNAVARFVEGRWIFVPTGLSQPLRGVWTDPSGTMVAVGDQGKIVRFDGTQLNTVATSIISRLSGVWGMDASEVWAVGDGGTVMRIVGDTGYRVPTPVDNGPSLSAVWGSSKDNVWAVGASGTIIRWDGSRWTQFGSPDASISYTSVFGTGPNDVWLLGNRSIFRWDGLVWRLVRQEQEQVLRGFARSPSDVWILREFQRVSNFNGAVWSRDVIPTASVTSVAAIAPAGGGGIWAAGSHGLITRGRNGFWTDTSGQTPSQNRYGLQAVWSPSPADAWACGNNVLLHWNGRFWDAVSIGDNIDCAVLFGSSTSDVWMFGSAGSIWHFDGTKWIKQQQMVSGVSFTAGVSVSPAEAYAVGSGGAVLVWNGSSWNMAPKLVTSTLRSAWVAAPNDIWMVGDAGVILRGQGVAWTQVPKPTAASFNAVRGTGANDVYLVGAELWHWNGTAFGQFPRATAIPAIPSYVNLRDVVAWPDGTALVVGDFGTVLAYRQGSWSVLSFGDTHSLVKMTPVGTTDAWVVGDHQTILRYSP